MLSYLLLVCVSVMAGFGLLSAGTTLDPVRRWCLSPAAFVVAWSVTVGIGVSAGVPVRDLALPLWLATGLTAVYGIRRARRAWTTQALAPLAVAVAIPIGVLAYDFAHGLSLYIGGPSPDGWSYVAYGQYLWQWPKGTEGSLSPLHQYATHLVRTRFISSALLGLLSPLTGSPGDTQTSVGLFIAWTLFVFGASCAGCGVIASPRCRWIALFCLLAVTSRWVFGAVDVHNDDNLLALSFLPFTVGIVTGITRPTPRSTAMLGAALAGCLYVYPEVALVVLFGLALAILSRAAVDRRWADWIVWGAVIIGVALVLVLPSWRDLVWFISNQVGAATSTAANRPGEGSFSEILNLRDWMTAFWGFGPAAGAGHFRAAWGVGRHVLGAAFWLLALIGAVRFAARGRWDVVVLAVAITVGAFLMVVREHYSYGAFKLLLIGGWAPTALVVSAAYEFAEMTTRWRERHALTSVRVVSVTVSAALASVAVVTAGAREISFHNALTASSIEPYRTLVALDRVLTSEPILVSVDDPVANQWAVYFLREHPVRLVGYRSYMAQPHVVPWMNRSTPIDVSAIRYVLSDDIVANGGASSDSRDVVWTGGPYALWRVPAVGAVVLVNIDSPNGGERVDGHMFYRIDGGDTRLDLVATAAGDAVISARFARDSSQPDPAERHLSLSANGGAPQSVTIDRDGDFALPIHVRPGANHLLVHLTEGPATAPSRDGRSLRIEIVRVRTRMVPPVREHP